MSEKPSPEEFQRLREKALRKAKNEMDARIIVSTMFALQKDLYGPLSPEMQILLDQFHDATLQDHALRETGEKAQAGWAKGGKRPKRRKAIFEAIEDRLRKSPDAGNEWLWASFPENGEGIFRDGETLYQEDEYGHLSSISRATFDRYVASARKNRKKSE